jgi:hypothetical protein
MNDAENKAAPDPAFADLAAQADALEKETVPASLILGAPAPVDYNAEARDLVEFLHSLFVPLYPSLATVYSPAVRARIAATAGPLMQKYDFTLGRFGPELAFGIVVVPLIAPTMQAIKHDREQLAKDETIAKVAKAVKQGLAAGAGAVPGPAAPDNGAAVIAQGPDGPVSVQLYKKA